MKVPAIGLRGRLALSIAVIMAVALAVTYVAVYRGTGADLREQTDNDLSREVDSLAASLGAPPATGPRGYAVRAERLVSAQPFGPASRLIAISIPGGGTVTNQPELLGLPAPGLDPVTATDDRSSSTDSRSSSDDHSDDRSDDEHRDESNGDDDHESARRLLRSAQGFTTVGVEDAGEVRLLTRVTELRGGPAATIRVGQPLASVDRALDGLSRTFLVVGLIALLAAIAAGWLLASRTARPIRRLAEVTEGVDGGDLSARMDIADTRNGEVRRLAESFNLMLDRLESAFLGQRAFVADASHDLRTPLTIVKGQLEVLSRNPDPDAAEVRRVTSQVTAATARMERLVDDLLLLARTDSGTEFEIEVSDLEPLLSAEVDSFREGVGGRVGLGEVSGRSVAIDRERLARAVSNLVANAVTHAGADGRIEVSASDRGDRVEINVDDDGPGVPVAERQRVFDRFARLDSARTSDRGGSGLGLAIVRAIAEAHGGEASCSDSPLGGARFTVSLPAILTRP